METERRELSPRQIEAASLSNSELKKRYYNQVRIINDINGPQKTLGRLGVGGVIVGTIIEAPLLVTVGAPVAAAVYMGGEALKSNHVILRDTYRLELDYRGISLPKAA